LGSKRSFGEIFRFDLGDRQQRLICLDELVLDELLLDVLVLVECGVFLVRDVVERVAAEGEEPRLDGAQCSFVSL
jgi:hypothetical protein